MKKILNKIISCVLICSMLIGVASCGKNIITVDIEDVVEFARDYCDALIDGNVNFLNDYSIDQYDEYFEGISFDNFSEDPEINAVYEAWFSTLIYEVSSVVKNGDVFEVNVGIGYANYDSFAFDYPNLTRSWINAINSTEEIYPVFTKFYVEGNTVNSLRVSNPDVVVDKALSFLQWDITNVVPDRGNNLAIHAVIEDTDSYETFSSNDNLQLVVTFDDDYGYFNNRGLMVEFELSTGETVTETMKGFELSNSPYIIAPVMFDRIAFPDGTLTVHIYDSNGIDTTVSYDTHTSYSNNYEYIGVPDHDNSIDGYIDTLTNVYINEYFGLQITFPQNFAVDPSDIYNAITATYDGSRVHVNNVVVDYDTRTFWVIGTVDHIVAASDDPIDVYIRAGMERTSYNGIDAVVESTTDSYEGDDYLEEDFYLFPGGESYIVIFRTSYDSVPDDGEVMDTVRRIH